MRAPAGLPGFLTAPLAAFLLTGCFQSDAPLIQPSQAVYPFKTISFQDQDGQKAALKREGDVYLYSEDAAPTATPHKPTPVLLYDLGEHSYLAQAEENGKAEYIFAKRDGDKVTFASLCKDVDPATLKALGIEKVGDEQNIFAECTVKDLNALVDLGKMPATWTKPTSTVQILSIE